MVGAELPPPLPVLVLKAGGNELATSEFNRIPAVEALMELSSTVPFARAGGVFALSRDSAESELARTRPKVVANEASPEGVPPVGSVAGRAGADACAGCA